MALRQVLRTKLAAPPNPSAARGRQRFGASPVRMTVTPQTRAAAIITVPGRRVRVNVPEIRPIANTPAGYAAYSRPNARASPEELVPTGFASPQWVASSGNNAAGIP